MRRRSEIRVALDKIFRKSSVTFGSLLSPAATPVTQAFRIQTMLFPYATAEANEA